MFLCECTDLFRLSRFGTGEGDRFRFGFFLLRSGSDWLIRSSTDKRSWKQNKQWNTHFDWYISTCYVDFPTSPVLYLSMFACSPSCGIIHILIKIHSKIWPVNRLKPLVKKKLPVFLSTITQHKLLKQYTQTFVPVTHRKHKLHRPCNVLEPNRNQAIQNYPQNMPW